MTRRRRTATRAFPALMFSLLCGCTLIDQRTFERRGQAPDRALIANAKDLPPLPLLTIRFDSPDADLQSSVTQAAEAVQSYKTDADYDVVAPLPINATLPVQDSYRRFAQIDSEAVVQALGYAGVSLDHVHVMMRGDPGSPPREVEVFVH